jgi:hypothetical protein
MTVIDTVWAHRRGITNDTDTKRPQSSNYPSTTTDRNRFSYRFLIFPKCSSKTTNRAPQFHPLTKFRWPSTSVMAIDENHTAGD